MSPMQYIEIESHLYDVMQDRAKAYENLPSEAGNMAHDEAWNAWCAAATEFSAWRSQMPEPLREMREAERLGMVMRAERAVH